MVLMPDQRHLQVGAEDVVIATENGRSTGLAFVEFRHSADGERMLSLDHKYFGARYIEVFESSLKEQRSCTGDA